MHHPYDKEISLSASAGLCYHHGVRLGVFAIVATLAMRPVAAAPTIDIKAQTQVVLDKVQVRDTGAVEVFGRLVDKLTGDGLGGQTVTIRIGGETVTARTDPDGQFRKVISARPGPATVALEFGGTPMMEASEQETATDPSRATVTLSMVVEQQPTDPEPRIAVYANVDDKAVPLEVALTVGAPTDPELASWKTIETGASWHPLPRADAGGPGSRRVRATFAGDETRQPAFTEATVELFVDTRTEMKLSSTDLAYEDDLEVTGRVVDADGEPLPRTAVTLVSGDRRLAQGATGDDGRYRFEVEAEIIGQGQFAVQVSSDPGLSYIRASRAEPVIIQIAAPQPVPVSYTIAAFIATLAAAGGFFLARTKPWQRLRKKAAPAEQPVETTHVEPASGGLVTAKPSVISTLRRPQDDGFSGVVRDTVRGRPVPGAVVRLLLGELEREVRTGDDGGFVIDKLVAGEWRAEVAAPGHVTERFGVSIPHRGELRGVRIDLVPVRERIFQLYRRAAEPVLPEPRLWGVWSPRQIVDHVRAKRPSPALAELTDFVEEVYFSGRTPAETVLPQASERVDRAVRERAA